MIVEASESLVWRTSFWVACPNVESAIVESVYENRHCFGDCGAECRVRSRVLYLVLYLVQIRLPVATVY